jgi:hypothetical protein
LENQKVNLNICDKKYLPSWNIYIVSLIPRFFVKKNPQTSCGLFILRLN